MAKIIKFIKLFVPNGIKNRFRPQYHRVLEKFKYSVVYPKPWEWRQKRRFISKRENFSEIYRFAQEEFGIIQVEWEIRSFFEFAKELKPETICEIGLKDGGNSFLFLRLMPSLKQLVSLDLAIKNDVKLNYFAGRKKKIRCIAGNSQTQEMLDNVRKELRGRTIDLLFIDGDHSYEGVKTDFELYKSLVTPGGVITFHDIVPDHVSRFGIPRNGQCDAGEVYRFWREVKGKYPHREFVAEPEQNGFGIGVIFYK